MALLKPVLKGVSFPCMSLGMGAAVVPFFSKPLAQLKGLEVFFFIVLLFCFSFRSRFQSQPDVKGTQSA